MVSLKQLRIQFEITLLIWRFCKTLLWSLLHLRYECRRGDLWSISFTWRTKWIFKNITLNICHIRNVHERKLWTPQDKYFMFIYVCPLQWTVWERISDRKWTWLADGFVYPSYVWVFNVRAPPLRDKLYGFFCKASSLLSLCSRPTYGNDILI